MLIMDQSYNIKVFHPMEDIDEIVDAGHICYKISKDLSFEEKGNYIEKLINLGHESPLEHSRLTVDFITNRGVSHELVRHRLASYNQESTRYCNYSNNRFMSQLSFIRDSSIADGPPMEDWLSSLKKCEEEYFRRLSQGYSAEQARGCLPNDLKTEIKVTANYREWRHIFKLRCDSHAHYQIQELLRPLQEELHSAIPFIF